MAINTTTLQTELKDDLKEFQDWATGSGTYMERRLFEAATWLYNAYTWDFTLTQGNLSTTSGNLGPYSLAAFTDFDVLAPEIRLSKYYAYDGFDIDAPIQDDAYGRRWEIYLVRSTGTPKLKFFADPGDGTKVFTYRKKLTSLTGLSGWPDDEEIKALLRMRTSYLMLINTSDWKKDAVDYKDLSEEALKDLKLKKRVGTVRQESREPRDVYGYPIYYGYAGEYE